MDLKFNVENEGSVTKEDIIEEADQIYAKSQEVWRGVKYVYSKSKRRYREPYLKTDDKKKIDNLLSRLQSEHKKFTQAYPTVLRHMVQENQYNSTAFRQYLDKVEEKPWTNDDERMDSYTDYAVLLLKAQNPGRRFNKTELTAFRREYRDRLQQEHDDFKKALEKCTKEVEELEKQYTAKRRANLLQAFERLTDKLGMDEDRRDNILNLVNADLMNLDEFETIVYNLKRIQCGETFEKIKEDRAHIMMPPNAKPEDIAKIKENISHS